MSAFFLFDTNIISELARAKPNPGVLDFVATVSDVMISSILFHELTFGVEVAPPERKHSLILFLQAIRDRFASRAIAIDVPIAETAARLRAFAKKQGRRLTLADSLVAGTAMVHDATLVTRNTKDFDKLSIALFNPFSSE
ncbi:MAG TPA: type II toxin-antitoxin system VapC family toxin [Methylocella sp.]|nr:type II toxin-antitoxin system VapC family toxin [Methylocella sp.]